MIGNINSEQKQKFYSDALTYYPKIEESVKEHHQKLAKERKQVAAAKKVKEERISRKRESCLELMGDSEHSLYVEFIIMGERPQKVRWLSTFVP